ncbi:hypothetical protein ACTNBM_04800 [Lachnospiraceae bacterium HCP1S3_C3]
MPVPYEYQQSHIKYAKKNLKRVPLDLPIDFYEKVKEYCEKNHKSVNGLIKELLLEKIKN